MNQQAERRVGTVIGGKWRVDALLGSGSMAAVYAATHRNGARTALKILHPTLCADPAVCERFLGEGYLANSVKHPGIVRVLDDGVTDDGCVFLVMDLLEGMTLEALRQERGNRIPLVEALDIADKLMDVLSAVHAAGIIHRDLKPQNVFVCNDGSVRLFDFGVARVFDRTSQSKLSVYGLVLGTPSFMSPEQALGSREKVDHRSDIWSLGATLFTALSGETVHLGANVQAKLLAAATVKARSIALVMPDLPESLAAAIDMALRFKKEDRWQSVDAMRNAFRSACQSLGIGLPEPAPATRSIVPNAPERASMSPNSGASSGVSSAPNSGSDGPGGTFIGIGSGDGKVTSVVGNDGSVPPGPVSPAKAPPINVPSRTPAPAPVGSFHPPPLAPVRLDGNALPNASRKSMKPSDGGFFARDGQESSIPAYGSTLQQDDGDLLLPTMTRRKTSKGIWIAGVLVAGGLLGGFAFFASNLSAKDPVDTGQASPGATTTDVTPTPPPTPTPAPTPSMIVIGDDPNAPEPPPTSSDPNNKGKTSTATPTSTKGHSSTASKSNDPPETSSRPANGSRSSSASKPNDAPSTPTATDPPKPPATPPGLAPDPFGAPD